MAKAVWQSLITVLSQSWCGVRKNNRTNSIVTSSSSKEDAPKLSKDERKRLEVEDAKRKAEEAVFKQISMESSSTRFLLRSPTVTVLPFGAGGTRGQSRRLTWI